MRNPVTSGRMLELDARSLAALANAANVTAWSDASGQGNHASVPSGCTAPTFRTNVVGTSPVVRFAGGTTALGGTFSGWTGAAGMTVSMLAIGRGAVDYGRWLALVPTGGSDYGSTGGVAIGQNAGTPRFNIEANGGSPFGSDALQLPTKPTLLGVRFGANLRSFDVNGMGVLGDTSAHSTANASIYAIAAGIFGGGSIGGGNAIIDVLHLVIYLRALADAELSAVARWQLSEFGLAPPTFAARPLGPRVLGRAA